jgi:CRISPR system Cascade subunit CasD
MGWVHRDATALDKLQGTLLLASRCDRPGVLLRDFQTVDLGSEFMPVKGWTTRGTVEERGGGSAKVGTHIRERFFLADAVYTLALGVREESAMVTLPDLEKALRWPSRPLFFGRKSCLPSAPIFLGTVEATSLRDALARAPAILAERRRDNQEDFTAWWPDDGDESTGMLHPVVDERDWANGIHVGRRLIRQGTIRVRPGETDA